MAAALITGAARRLGRQMALYLAGRGYDVAIHYDRSEPEALATVAEARDLGVAAHAFQADLLDEGATAELIPHVTAQMGPLSLLVNNASIFEHDDIRSATMRSWDRHIGSNLRAPFQLTQAFAAQAATAGRDDRGEPVATGLVVNMVDQRVLKPTPEFLTYAIAKSGLWAMTQMLAQALAPDIRVNAIGPGPTLAGGRQSDRQFAEQRRATVLGRGSDPEDICAALGYLIDAKAVTGQLLCVDGGQHLGWQTVDVVGHE
ncbi:SDR family oxidoreductase [Paracoccus fistulariae]|uniref:SDR family oxidoreductase n=1 Tax=Paracoccus fistulariae TaxID=658446 RepID=A0ABY7SGM6_9RHOB|nr:SDR family oxidoreductase [Paracoccus fistulariae]MDB6181711.1 SDR family oxidoreductase [Paracoccus fistulariae]WCR05989.1 SDR family oxidoreductase [Paracoccus fistulariae]